MIIPAIERQLKNRVGVGITIRNSLTFAYRALLKMLHNPEVFMEITIMPIMFTLMFAYLFGGAISGSVENYLPIIIPGILVQTFVTSCATAGLALRDDKDKSITNRFKSMPIARVSPIAGVLIADLIRYAVAGTIVFVVGYIIGYRPQAGIFAVIACILFMMFVSWCLGWIFAFICLAVKSVTTAMSASMLIMFPLTFFSNAFVPTETLPGWIQFFVLHINPLSRVITSVRQILSQGNIGADFWLAILASLIILVVFVPLTLRVYKRNG